MLGEIDKYWCEKNMRVIGVDEAGRGPLCGPVVTAAVSLLNDVPGLDDSKKLTEKKRTELFPLIIKNSVWSVFSVRPEVVDELNILHATMYGMTRCISKVIKRLGCDSIVLIDGNRITGNFGNEECIVKGDSKSINIAAASILAKVHRDRIMLKWSKIYPEYNFQGHKGYATLEHYELLKKFGPCEIHRKSFKLYREKTPEQTTLF